MPVSVRVPAPAFVRLKPTPETLPFRVRPLPVELLVQIWLAPKATLLPMVTAPAAEFMVMPEVPFSVRELPMMDTALVESAVKVSELMRKFCPRVVLRFPAAGVVL